PDVVENDAVVGADRGGVEVAQRVGGDAAGDGGDDGAALSHAGDGDVVRRARAGDHRRGGAGGAAEDDVVVGEAGDGLAEDHHEVDRGRVGRVGLAVGPVDANRGRGGVAEGDGVVGFGRGGAGVAGGV